jgi:MFS family permease
VDDATDRTYTGTEGVTRSEPRQSVVITALGITQIFAWGCWYYLLVVLATPITTGTGWSLQWVVGGLSLGLLVAGPVSPVVGRAIQDYGGRPILAISSILLAAGLIAIGLSQNVAVYLVGWIIVGLGMGAGLYDAAFATLGRIYRERARGAITILTLFGGFSSAICWPLSWFLVQSTGWRNACLMGRLALPSLLAQAISPLVGAAILESGGAGEILLVLFAVAQANVVVVTMLALFSRSTRDLDGSPSSAMRAQLVRVRMPFGSKNK